MSLDHAILGFLALRPMSGYDLKKAFDGSVGHFWTADQAQIYRTLRRLEDDGLVDVKLVRQDGKPDRKEHQVTAKGLEELDTWLAASVDPVPVREPFLMKLFFAGRLDVSNVMAMLEQRVVAAEEQLEVLEDIASHVPDTDLELALFLRRSTLDNGIAQTRAELKWASSLLEEIGSRFG